MDNIVPLFRRPPFQELLPIHRRKLVVSVEPRIVQQVPFESNCTKKSKRCKPIVRTKIPIDNCVIPCTLFNVRCPRKALSGIRANGIMHRGAIEWVPHFATKQVSHIRLCICIRHSPVNKLNPIERNNEKVSLASSPPYSMHGTYNCRSQGTKLIPQGSHNIQ